MSLRDSFRCRSKFLRRGRAKREEFFVLYATAITILPKTPDVFFYLLKIKRHGSGILQSVDIRNTDQLFLIVFIQSFRIKEVIEEKL